MQAIVKKAQRVYANLSDIQPAISISGMDAESQAIINMKYDLAEMLVELTSDKSRADQVLGSLRADVLSSFSAVQRSTPLVLDMVSDEQLQDMYLATANWVARYREYVAGREAQRTQRTQRTQRLEG